MKLPIISAKELIKFLSKKGFAVSRQKGSHVIMKKILGNEILITVIPLHEKIDTGTLLSIMKQAQVTREEILAEFVY
jgi:predicted RNA binding protein YcfA (HicA-like mRNA interferase family)